MGISSDHCGSLHLTNRFDSFGDILHMVQTLLFSVMEEDCSLRF